MVFHSTIDFYMEILGRLKESGYDVDDFYITAGDRTDEGNIWGYDFLRRVSGADRYIKRQLSRREEHRRASRSSHQEPEKATIPNSVFVVHGQDQDAAETIVSLLREVELLPRDFADARRMTASPMPYVGEVLATAFEVAQAVLLIFTPDERVELKDRLRGERPIQVDFQPRPNVLIEAGIALATHPDRTVIVEMGTVRPISDLAGRHVVRWTDDTPAARSELLDRLTDAG
jgi:predicted nucleotide-binding protein